MKALKKKVLGPGPNQWTLLDKRPQEQIYDALNMAAIQYMNGGSDVFQAGYGKLLHSLDSVVKEGKSVMKETFGPGSEFRREFDEFKRMMPEMTSGIRDIVGTWWKDTKENFKPYVPPEKRQDAMSCEADALKAFVSAAADARASVSQSDLKIGPVTQELMSVSYAHDVMDFVESCVGVRNKMADSTAISYVKQCQAESSDYVLSDYPVPESYSDVLKSFYGEIERAGELKSKPEPELVTAEHAAEPVKPKSASCQHNLRGLELRDDSNSPDKICSFD